MGIILLLYCVVRIWRAKRQTQTNEALNAQIKSVIPLNMLAMGLSGLGLMIVIIGIVLHH